MPATKTTELNDFSDRFSPMLVKELRQGLRTNLFVTAFILLQAFMILCILMGASTTDSTTSGASGFFWFFIIVALVVVQPLRGFAALSSEYNLNTMDLIQLTQLDAWRITLGKWFAINAQTFLLVAAVAPYLVLRYFFGSINIVSDLGGLALCTIASALLSAITVGCSAYKNLIVRMTMLIGSVILFIVMWAYTMEVLFRYSTDNMKQIGLLVYSSIFGIFFFLAFGATVIAPGSENMSSLKRCIGVVWAIGAWAFQLFGTDKEVCNVVASIILGVVVIDAITEKPPVFGAVLRPFTSFVKRPFAAMLTPGWHTGILFLIFVLGILWGPLILFYCDFTPNDQELGVFVYGAGMITFPLLIIHLFFRKSNMPHFALYLFIQAALAVLTLITMAVTESPLSVPDELVYLLVGIPTVLFFGNFESSDLDIAHLVIGTFWLGLSILIPLIRGFGLYREMFRVFKASKKS